MVYALFNACAHTTECFVLFLIKLHLADEMRSPLTLITHKHVQTAQSDGLQFDSVLHI